MFEKHYIEQTDSTNNHLKRMLAESALPQGYTLYTFHQTAGRGQQGNTWDSEKGKNLLFSVCLQPDRLPVAAQFRISMAVTLQTVQALLPYLPDVCIKWPNDIYCRDHKLAGILIENQLSEGFVSHSVIGIGINVNQTRFRSDIPNPTSLKLLTGSDFSNEELLDAIITALSEVPALIAQPVLLKQQYLSCLYRREGLFPYRELSASQNPVAISRNDSTDCFMAETTDVEDDGRLVLHKADGTTCRYHFKQIQFVIP